MIIQKTAWCGIDISKNTFDAAYYPGSRDLEFQAIPANSFPRTPSGLRSFYQWLDLQRCEQDDQIRIIMEATGNYSLQTTSWILKDHPEFQPAIINPRHASAYHKSLGLPHKTDQIDCRALAMMGRERKPPAYQPLSSVRAQLRELTRQRVSFVEERTAWKNRFIDKQGANFISKLQDKHLKHLDKTIALIEKEIRRLIETDSQIREDMALLESIPGVGFITAITVLAEFGDLSLFRRSRNITSMAGLLPRSHDSGKSVRKRPRMSKQGNNQVRAVLYMAAIVAAYRNPHLAEVYKRLRERGKSSKSALGAVMRKLLVLMRALVISRQAYDPLWKATV